MVVMLERFVEDGSNSIVLRHLASGYLPCCLGSLRVGNAQHCWIPLQLTDVEILGSPGNELKRELSGNATELQQSCNRAVSYLQRLYQLSSESDQS